MLFKTFLQAGFECTAALPKKRPRLQILSATMHDQLCREDYERLRDLNIQTVREGLSWSEIEHQAGSYDFSHFLSMLKVGQEMGIQQIWDLNHFDYPTHLDFFSPSFPEAFKRYALQAHAVLREYIDGPLLITPLNEISYFSWIAGQEGIWAPFGQGRGDECKRQLIKAALAAMSAIWKVDSEVRFIHPDPILYRKAKDPNDFAAASMAEDFAQIRFQAWDMLSGRQAPELGGEPKYLDIIGVNYYYHNQEWIMPDPKLPGGYMNWGMDWDSPDRVSFADLLKLIYERYERPLYIAETGAHGELRQKWWQRTLPEIEAARQSLPILGMCIYPVVDYPDWLGMHLTNSGLWDFEADDPDRRRIPHQPSLELIKAYAQKLNTQD